MSKAVQFDLRLRKLENRSIGPEEFQRAYRCYSCTGYLPADPRLAKLVETTACYLEALRESMPGPPEPTPEEIHGQEGGS